MAKPLPALRTHEGFLAGVDPLVLPQVTKVVKMAAAVPTLVPALDFYLLLQLAPSPPDPDTGSGPVFVLISLRPPGLSATAAAAVPHTGCSGGSGLQGLQGLSTGRVRVYQFNVFLQEQGVGTEGSTQRADVGVRGERT